MTNDALRAPPETCESSSSRLLKASRAQARGTGTKRREIVRLAACAVLLLTPALMACAHEKPSAPVDATTLPPLPRSSVAAVVQQRAKLGRTDDQVRNL